MSKCINTIYGNNKLQIEIGWRKVFCHGQLFFHEFFTVNPSYIPTQQRRYIPICCIVVSVLDRGDIRCFTGRYQLDLVRIKAAGGAEKGASISAWGDHVPLIEGRICYKKKEKVYFCFYCSFARKLKFTATDILYTPTSTYMLPRNTQKQNEICLCALTYTHTNELAGCGINHTHYITLYQEYVIYINKNYQRNYIFSL